MEGDLKVKGETKVNVETVPTNWKEETPTTQKRCGPGGAEFGIIIGLISVMILLKSRF